MTRKEIKNAMCDLGIKNIDVIRHIRAEGAIKCSPSEFSLTMSGDLKTEKADKIKDKTEAYIEKKKRGEV